MFTIEDIYYAYRKLKSYVYYDNTSLFLRKQIAEFENENFYNSEIKNSEDFKRVFGEKLDNLLSFLNKNMIDTDLIEKIGFKYTPKRIKRVARIEENYITNKVSSIDKIIVEQCNYIIDAPIEIHIICVLWLTNVGKDLCKYINECNYAYRLLTEDQNGKTTAVNGLQLYQPYFNGYQEWRDKALSKAISLLDEGKAATILSLDIKRYFYSAQIDLCELINSVNKDLLIDSQVEYLTKYIISINKKYTSIFPENSDNIDENKTIIPVGLLSSGLIGNLYLHSFDKDIIRKLNPAYYGRYVDDILFVFSDREVGDKDIISSFINTHFVARDILIEQKAESDDPTKLHKAKNQTEYKLNGKEELFIQQDKIIMEHFLPNESRAAINNFKRNLNKQRSEFRFLPDEETVSDEFDNEAFTLQYSDSINKIRSIQECSEDKFGASRFLANKIYLSSLVPKSHLSKDNIIRYHLSSKQILTFFKGRNCIAFYSLWEKVATYFIINDDKDNYDRFKVQTQKAIDAVNYNEGCLKVHLKEYFDISCSSAIAMNLNFDNSDQNVKEVARRIRHSNMFRHTLLPVSCINYTSVLFEDNINLITYNQASNVKLNLGENISQFLSPRFVHYYELQITDLYKNPASPKANNSSAWECFNRINYIWRDYFKGAYNLTEMFIVEEPNTEKAKSGFTYCGINESSNIQFDSNVSSDKVIAIANMKVLENNFLATIDKHKSPNLTRKRRRELFDIINTAVKEKCDIVTLPELSVPFQWLEFLSYQSRKKDIAIIAGLEYVVDSSNNAYNYTAVILPVNTGKYRTSVIALRNKKHYSPAEEEQITGLRLQIPSDMKNTPHHLYHWRKVYFSVFNCFELADISDRSAFKSKIDFFVAIEHNKDISYFSDVIGSSARDLHCYVIQVNTSQYGDSRIIKPASSTFKDMVIVKGGRNNAVLVDKIEIDSLRMFQNKEYNLQSKDKQFKLTPPSYDKEMLDKRIRDEKITSND